MIIKKTIEAGTEDKSDVKIVISPSESGRNIEISKIPHKRFIEHELELINSILDRMNVKDVNLDVYDFGALDFVIEARLEAGLVIAGE